MRPDDHATKSRSTPSCEFSHSLALGMTPLLNRAPDERICRHRLPAILRSEAVQHDVPAPVLHVDERRLAVELRSAEQPAGREAGCRTPDSVATAVAIEGSEISNAGPFSNQIAGTVAVNPRAIGMIAFDLHRENGSRCVEVGVTQRRPAHSSPAA